jgi:hypothetical protein
MLSDRDTDEAIHKQRHDEFRRGGFRECSAVVEVSAAHRTALAGEIP